jgi:hypothetical protein
VEKARGPGGSGRLPVGARVELGVHELEVFLHGPGQIRSHAMSLVHTTHAHSSTNLWPSAQLVPACGGGSGGSTCAPISKGRTGHRRTDSKLLVAELQGIV